jgi:hypothetical protein
VDSPSPAQVPQFRMILLWSVLLEESTPSAKSGLLNLAQRLKISGQWETVSMQPERGRPPEVPYEEFVYFHPFVRRFLYGPASGKSGDLPLTVLARTGLQNTTLQIAARPKEGSGDVTLPLNVERAQLYVFDTRVAILAVELCADNLPTAPGVGWARPVDCAMDLLDRVRRVFPPYWLSG